MSAATTTAAAASEVQRFKEFLRINTMHPKPDLVQCVAWLKKQAEELNLLSQVVTFVEGLPVVILSRPGTDPSLPSIGLNCHMDVVPVVAEKWDKLPPGVTPFSAWEDTANGRIYARGAQDMKCVGAQYLCALKRLAETPLQRTVHTIWVPDEEIGGEDGMKKFVNSKEFRSLNIGCMMDEGLAHDENKFVIFTGERSALWVRLAVSGGPMGHGAKLIADTAFDRLSNAISRLSALRKKNSDKLEKDPSLRLGDVSSVNITVVQGGISNDGGKTYAANVIPADAFLLADIRCALVDYEAIKQELQSLAKEFSLDMTFTGGADFDGPSPYSDPKSIWMRKMEAAIQSSRPGVVIERAIFPAATDSRYVRRVGVPAFGFSPMRNMPSLLHDHNEYLDRSTYLEGVDVMTAIVEQLANIPAQPLPKL